MSSYFVAYFALFRARLFFLLFFFVIIIFLHESVPAMGQPRKGTAVFHEHFAPRCCYTLPIDTEAHSCLCAVDDNVLFCLKHFMFRHV